VISLSNVLKIPCSIIRGGTSKGIFFRSDNLPEDLEKREKVILRAFGSPDLRQIDGLAGANSLTSKVAIIGPSKDEAGVIDYTFGQVSITSKVIDWTGNCGNLSSAVGLFAVGEGLVPVTEPTTKVVVFNTNTQKKIHITMPASNGEIQTEGQLMISGVPFPGAPFLVEFEDPSGSVTKKLLPTGHPVDSMEIPGFGKFHYSLVDAANPVVFLLAEELGLEGVELPEAVEKMADKLEKIEAVRSRVCVEMGLAETPSEATRLSPAIPKIGFVSRVRSYTTPDGENVGEEGIDLVARLASMQKMHRAYMVTGAICTAVASQIEGTVVWEVLRESAKRTGKIRIGQPYGPMEVNLAIDRDRGFKVERAGVWRTARRILDGCVYVPESQL